MGRGHRHTWRPNPPGGRWRQSWDEVEWDEEEMASNKNTNSQDKLEDIKFFLSRDPNYRNSDDWPELVEWCSSCPDTRRVKFVMEDTKVTEEAKVKVKEEVMTVEEVHQKKPKEVKVKQLEESTQTPNSEEPPVDCSREVCTQTLLAASTRSTQVDPLEEGKREEVKEDVKEEEMKDKSCQTEGGKRKRGRGGRSSRMRRLLAFQLLLTERRGLPLSRLLSLKKTEAKSPRQRRRREEEVSASPQLRRRRVVEEEGGEASSPSPSIPFPCPPPYTIPHTPPYTPLHTPPHTPSYIPPYNPPYTPPYTPPYNPPFTLSYTPLQTPQCGPIPGPQWVFCGPCHSCGSTVPLAWT